MLRRTARQLAEAGKIDWAAEYLIEAVTSADTITLSVVYRCDAYRNIAETLFKMGLEHRKERVETLMDRLIPNIQETWPEEERRYARLIRDIRALRRSGNYYG